MIAILPALILLGLLLLTAYATVTRPELWQRTASLAVFALLVTFIFWAVAPAIRYSHSLYYRKTVIGPAYQLWGITATNIARGNIDQANRDISYIRDNWMKIGTDSSRYTGMNLLQEIQKQQKGEQAGAGYPPQGVGSPDP